MINQINTAIINLLSANLSDILPNPGQIGLCSVDEPGDIVLAVYLFSVCSCKEISASSISAKGRNIQVLPPRFLNLFYLITVFGKAEATFRVAEEHRILTRAMQVFDETPVLNEQILGFKPGWTDDIKLTVMDLEYDELSNIWERTGANYRLSAVYKVCPVELPRLSGKSITRASGTDFSGNQV